MFAQTGLNCCECGETFLFAMHGGGGVDAVSGTFVAVGLQWLALAIK